MLKIFLIPAIILFLHTYSQGQNTIIKDQKSGRPLLIGNINREVFSDSAFSWWFDSQYENYEINEILLDSLTSSIDSIQIIIVLGTWCSDSRREVPRFLKILDYLNFPQDHLSMLCVDRDKKGIGDSVDTLGIEFVPTIIIFKDKKELGRIIETPVGTLESDLKKILNTVKIK